MKKVILKLTGEAFSLRGQGLQTQAVAALAKDIKQVVGLGWYLGIVNGGGNLVRGRNAKNLAEHLKLDYLGMVATIKNGQALEKALKKLKIKVKLLVSVPHGQETVFNHRLINQYFKKYQVLILAGGTGLPFFSTDTAAVLRALQLEIPTIWKASNVAGLYSADPKKNPQAKLIKQLSTASALEHHYAVVDQTALALSVEHKISWRIFKYNSENLINLAKGKQVGSLIK